MAYLSVIRPVSKGNTMTPDAGLNDVEEVTLKALAVFKGNDTPLDRKNVGYGFLVDTLVNKGFVKLNGTLCTLTLDGRTEWLRLKAI
ncbi:MAG: hypothetical protein JWN73_1701 [Betaproteobacteria bacterium]|nr:hypothetical protein [Betaproteobacteria bacterium]